jgi:hypothetical protein
MGYEINSNKDIIEQVNDILKSKENCIVNIVNDKLTLSVFSLLEKNIKNVKEINFVIRDTRFISKESEIAENSKCKLIYYLLISSPASSSSSLASVSVSSFFRPLK